MKITKLKKSPYDSRDYKYSSTVTTLPSKVDLRAFTTEIEDQQQQGSCTANATTSALELLTNRAGRYEDLSRQFLYYTSRDYESRIGQDGAVLRDALKMSNQYGVCLESEWAYSANMENTRPPQVCYDSASTRKVTRYEAVPISSSNIWETVYGIKSALAEGLPVVIAMAVYDSIFQINAPLREQNYSSFNSSTGNYYPFAGNHAVTIVGYDDAEGYFIFVNSWGQSWGDKGFGALKYGMTTEIFEAWIARGFDGIEINKPLPTGAVMTTTIKLQGVANQNGEIVFPHSTPGLQNKILRADAVYQDANWPEVRRPMKFTYCDQTNLRFDEPASANRPVFASFEYES